MHRKSDGERGNDRTEERRKVYGFKAERQAAFSRNVRKAYLEEGRGRKDEERSRMEAYRKLCVAEGITSTRLAEYDRTRAAASAQLKSELENIDYDQSLTNNEKKKKKYNAKRKFAATTVNELLQKKQKKYSALTGIEEVQRKRQAEREEQKQQREMRVAEKEKRLKSRKTRNALEAKRTKRGQPVLSSRVESLLSKLTN